MNNKYFTLCVDLELDKKEAEKYLESRLNCKILNFEKINLSHKAPFNRYDAKIELSEPIHGNRGIRSYFETKLEGNNLVYYLDAFPEESK